MIARRGKKVTAIIPIEDLERLQELENALDIEKIEHALKTEKFENWNTAKKDILKHLDSVNVRSRHSKKS